MRASIATAFFLSGLAGLMHEVVWAKLLVRLIGATAYAQSVVLAVFMGGLALGAAFFGRRSDRMRDVLRGYVWLELAIGGYCLLLPWILGVVGAGYLLLASHWVGSGGIELALRFGLSLLVVAPPAVCMGATLPLLVRSLTDEAGETGRRVAGLYSLNSLGAVLGAGLAGFVTLPAIGTNGSLILASFANFASAGLVEWRRRRDARSASEGEVRSGRERTAAGSEGVVRRLRATTLVALVLIGFSAMGYEVVFLRVIALASGSSTYSFTLMLMCFITGIAVGSGVVARCTVRDPLRWLLTSQLLVVVSLLAILPLVARLPYWMALLRVTVGAGEGAFELYQLGRAGLCFALLAVPTACLGAGFPLVAQIQTRTREEVGARVGHTYAWSTFGNVAGVLVTSLVLVPWLGLEGAFETNLLASALAAFALLGLASASLGWVRSGAVAAVLLAAGATYTLFASDWSRPLTHVVDHLRVRGGTQTLLASDGEPAERIESFAAWRHLHERTSDSEKFFFAEDVHGTVLVWGEDDDISLQVNGKGDASTKGDLTTQLMLAHAPLLLAPEARSVLVIGYGSGITVGSALEHPLERLDVVEISPAVLEADRLFAPHNDRALSDARVRAFVDDGQTFLALAPEPYDVIISEPSNPWIKGIGGLFTVEFFETVRSRLRPGGLFCLWFHAYEQNDEMLALVLRTLHSVFPHAILFRDFVYMDLMVVASAEAMEVDFAAMEDRFETRGVRDDLARIGVSNLASWLVHHAVGPADFGKMYGPGRLNTIAGESLEYVGPRSLFAGTQALSILEHLPYYRGPERPAGTLLEGYARYRASQGDPLRRDELRAVADTAERADPDAVTMGHRVARWMRARAGEVPGGTASRVARGAPLAPGHLGYHEALLAAERSLAAGRPEEASDRLRRALAQGAVPIGPVVEVGWALQEKGAHAERVDLLLLAFERALEATPPYERTAALLADTLAGDPETKPRAREAFQEVFGSARGGDPPDGFRARIADLLF